jgi:uncharacterized protein (TIGR02171 family)
MPFAGHAHESLLRTRRYRLSAAASLMAAVLFGCTPKDNPVTESYRYPGMVRVASAGASVWLGSDAAEAKNDERPMIQASFSYDFHIDSTEVTVEHYEAITGKKPPEYDTVAAQTGVEPVRYVSWYDAVLFCNARSRREGLDTVYRYRSVQKTGTGIITGLDGLRIEYAADGFRLPTEAEWIYAARGSEQIEYIWGDDEDSSAAAVYAWYADNADGTPHEVASLQPNHLGLYDMAGNVAEWVNDSKAAFQKVALTDFAGGMENALSLKILKGGSFKHPVLQLRIAGRSDDYPVDAVSRNGYTGFRCVAGKIAHPVYLNPNSGIPQDYPVSIVQQSLLPVTGTNRAKLAFVNVVSREQRLLCWVDYTVKPPQLQLFTDSMNINCPTISPDGRYVAWSTRDEGFTGAANVYVRRLSGGSTVVRLPDAPAFIPRWHHEPGTADTFVVYVTSAEANDLASWSAAQTRMMRFSGGAFSGEPVTLTTAGAYHGGLSADGRYLATGYPRLKVLDRSTGTTRTLFYAPFDGKSGSDTSQVCNVSLISDTAVNDQVLFLDFGSGRDTSTITHTVYRSHQYLFRADGTGTTLSYYRIPEPFDSWNHAEWSPRSSFAVAAAADGEGLQRSIHCINLSDAATTLLVEGNNLHHPYFWMVPGSDSIPSRERFDSLGHYDDPHLAYVQLLLAEKMRLFWHFAPDREVVFLGSSVVNDGIDSKRFTGLKGFNFGLRSGGYATAKLLLTDYVLNHCPDLKVVGLSLDPQMLFIDDEQIELHVAIVNSKGYRYDVSHDFWTAGLPPGFQAMINGVIDPYESIKIDAVDSLGMGPFNCSGWGEGAPPIYADLSATVESAVYLKQRACLTDIYAACSTAGVELLLVNFPIRPGYDSTEAYGPAGPSHETAAALFEDIAADTARYPHLYFYDANNFGDHDYTSNDFVDPMHLCRNGATKISTRIDSILQEIVGDFPGKNLSKVR